MTFLKWAGGKAKLIPQYQPYIPERIDYYFEPFLGGGAMFFYLKRENPNMKALLGDVNLNLINCYRVVRDRVDELISLLKEFEGRQGKEYYYQIRSEFNRESPTGLENAARFIYLNKLCFNGLFRVNKKGEFNVPYAGTYRKLYQDSHLKECSKLLQGVYLKHLAPTDVFDSSLYDRENEFTFVYLDPPYIKVTESEFSYTKFTFGIAEHERLKTIVKVLNERGYRVLLSNSESAKNIFLGMNVVGISAPRSINRNGGDRGNVKEILVIGGGTQE